MVAVFFSGCAGYQARGSGDGGTTTGGPTMPEISIFTGAQALSVTAPRRCEFVNLSDATTFEWQLGYGQAGTGEDRVFASIFGTPPIAGSEIKNPQDAVWWWSSGWKATSGQGSDGRVTFGQGRGTAAGGEPDVTVAPDTSKLQLGHWYWFAVWAWNSDFKVVKASEARAFCDGLGCDCDPVREAYCQKLPGGIAPARCGL